MAIKATNSLVCAVTIHLSDLTKLKDVLYLLAPAYEQFQNMVVSVIVE